MQVMSTKGLPDAIVGQRFKGKLSTLGLGVGQATLPFWAASWSLVATWQSPRESSMFVGQGDPLPIDNQLCSSKCCRVDKPRTTLLKGIDGAWIPIFVRARSITRRHHSQTSCLESFFGENALYPAKICT